MRSRIEKYSIQMLGVAVALRSTATNFDGSEIAAMLIIAGWLAAIEVIF
jgi:hypothetical protein